MSEQADKTVDLRGQLFWTQLLTDNSAKIIAFHCLLLYVLVISSVYILQWCSPHQPSINSKPITLHMGQFSIKWTWVEKLFSCECQAVAAIQVRSSFLWDMAPRHWVIGARRFRTVCWSHLQGSNAITLSRNVDHQWPRDARHAPENETSNFSSPRISRVQQFTVSQCNALKNRDIET